MMSTLCELCEVQWVYRGPYAIQLDGEAKKKHVQYLLAGHRNGSKAQRIPAAL